jgi:hypothetical protein
MSSMDTGWFKSSHSGSGNDTCVEVRLTGDAVGLRDSKNPDGGALRVDPAAWASFIALVPSAGGR